MGVKCGLQYHHVYNAALHDQEMQEFERAISEQIKLQKIFFCVLYCATT